MQFDGIVLGKVVNRVHLVVSTILNFMIVASFGCPEFLCKMLLVREPDLKFIFEQKNIGLDAT